MLARKPFFSVLMTLLFAANICVQAQQAKDELKYVKKVNESIDRGIQYLQQQEGGVGNWERFRITTVAGYEGGYSALVTLSLLNSGIKPDEKIMQRALKYLRNQKADKTYNVSLIIMALSEARQKEDLIKIQDYCDWLISTAVRSKGKIIGWSYPVENNNISTDGSNTQYALLGLYAGKLAGVKIKDEIWQEIRDLYLQSGKDESKSVTHWSYSSGLGNKASFSMTTAGICGLLIARMGLSETEQALDPQTGIAAKCGIYKSDLKIESGMNFIASNFAFEDTLERKSNFYNAYGIERLGRLSGQRFIGRYDWYRAGCDWFLSRQNPTGSWSLRSNLFVDQDEVLATAFALLYLSKGRVPVLISKLAFGQHVMTPNGMLTERKEDGGSIGWNRKKNDARHLVEYASRELFEGVPLAWQVYDPRRSDLSKQAELIKEVGILVESPILYMNGHESPYLSGQQKELLKQYVEKGGFILAEACCGSEKFTKGFAELMAEIFPESELRPVPKEHPIWQSYAAIPPSDFPNLQCMNRGCRTVVVLSTEPLSGYWEEPRFIPEAGKPAANRGQKAFKLAANIIAYATGLEAPKQRGTQRDFTNEIAVERNLPKGALKPMQIRIPGEPAPAPAALRSLANYMKTAGKFDIVTDKESYKEPISLNDAELFRFKFLYMHGKKTFTFNEEQVTNLRSTLDLGGLLFADACCGGKDFDLSFREICKRLYPKEELKQIPLEDALFSEKLNGEIISTVKRREKAGSGFSIVPPALEGIQIDGRWVVVYSKYDIGCAIEGNKSTECLGHDRDSAMKLASAALLYSLKR